MIAIMVRTPRRPRSGCPINFGLEIFGDKWTLLILRDLLMQGKSSFAEFQASEEGIASNILSERLLRLEQSGLVRRHAVKDDARQVRYVPTDACHALLPVLVEMAYWGATHDMRTAAPKSFVSAYEADRARLLKALSTGVDPTKN
jgi:DNA-binding HxlR family transcriptional regulator